MYVKMAGILMVIIVENQNQNVKIVKSNQVHGFKMAIGRDQRTIIEFLLVELSVDSLAKKTIGAL